MAHELPETSPQNRPRRRVAVHWQILLGLLVGAVVGLAANRLASHSVTPGVRDAFDQDANGVDDRLDWWAVNVADPLGRVFLRLIFMVVVPLVFSALVLGVAGLGDVRKLGRVGLSTLAYTLGLSTSAVLLGVVLVNSIRPGAMLPEKQREVLTAQYASEATAAVVQAKQARPLKDLLLDVIPENPLQEMVGAVDGSSKGNGMLSVMFFALMLGLAITFVPEQAATLVAFLEGLNAVSMAIIGFAMRLAPYGVACLVFSITARLGLALVPPLAGFVLTVVLGIAIQLLVVYPLVIRRFARMSPLVFFRGVADAMLMAFGTCSSNATLPTSLQVAKENLGLSPQISNFVLTIGATGNQNGSALFEGVAVLFLAQVFHVDLSFGQQVTVVVMAVMAGLGTAGVPGGSFPMLVVVLQSVGIPGESIGIILGIDRLCNMCRAMLNVTGDLAIAACVGRREAGEETDGVSEKFPARASGRRATEQLPSPAGGRGVGGEGEGAKGFVS